MWERIEQMASSIPALRSDFHGVAAVGDPLGLHSGRDQGVRERRPQLDPSHPAPVQQCGDQVGAEETGAAGDQDAAEVGGQCCITHEVRA